MELTLAFLVIVTGYFVLVRFTHAGQNRVWLDAARTLGLRVNLQVRSRSLCVEGVIDGLFVRASYFNDRAIYVITVDLRGAISDDLTVVPRDAYVFREVVTGDPDFDRRFWARGAPRAVSALLNGEVRAILFELVLRGYPSIEAGSLVMSCEGQPDDARIVRDIRGLVSAAKSIASDPSTEAERLVDELAETKIATVARCVFERLVAERTRSDLLRDAVSTAISSSDRVLLLAALPHVDPEELDHSERVREIFEDARGDDALLAASVLALQKMRAALPVPVRELLFRAGPRARAAIAAIVPSLDAAENHEALLLQLLRDPEEQVQRAAAESLALVGTVASVGPLSEWAKGIFRPAWVKDLAYRGIREVRSRAALAGIGQLSFAADAELGGEISLSDGSGSVSLDPDE